MVVATFDTLKYANTLKAAGVPDKQAEAQAAVLGEALGVNLKELVTKEDLTLALRETEQRLTARMDSQEAKFDGEIKLLKWMIGLAISLLIAVLVRLFFFRVP